MFVRWFLASNNEEARNPVEKMEGIIAMMNRGKTIHACSK
jgi:hypothetical protein